MDLEDSGIVRDGRLLILAYDHGMEHGPGDLRAAPTLDPERVFEIGRNEDVTAVAVQKGLAETYYEGEANLIVKVNGSTSMTTGEPYSAGTCSVERAAEIGADAVGFTMYGGSGREGEMFEEFAAVQETARAHGLPVVMWSYPRGGSIEDDQSRDVISYGARLALELGADVAKVKYPGSAEAAREAAAMAGETKVTLSGGAKTGDREFLETVHEVVQAGFAGLAVGRNIWQREEAEDYLEKVADMVWERATPDEVL